MVAATVCDWKGPSLMEYLTVKLFTGASSKFLIRILKVVVAIWVEVSSLPEAGDMIESKTRS